MVLGIKIPSDKRGVVAPTLKVIIGFGLMALLTLVVIIILTRVVLVR